MFFSTIDGGSYLNNQKIEVSQRNFKDALLATGFPYQRKGRLTKQMSCIKQLLENSQRIRRYGTAAMDLAYVACGRFDGYYEQYLNSWDIAAGLLIAKNAGA